MACPFGQHNQQRSSAAAFMLTAIKTGHIINCMAPSIQCIRRTMLVTLCPIPKKNHKHSDGRRQNDGHEHICSGRMALSGKSDATHKHTHITRTARSDQQPAAASKPGDNGCCHNVLRTGEPTPLPAVGCDARATVWSKQMTLLRGMCVHGGPHTMRKIHIRRQYPVGYACVYIPQYTMWTTNATSPLHRTVPPTPRHQQPAAQRCAASVCSVAGVEFAVCVRE